MQHGKGEGKRALAEASRLWGGEYVPVDCGFDVTRNGKVWQGSMWEQDAEPP
jgi:hypothetical protein